MSASTGASLVLALISSLLIFCGMRLYLPWIIATQIRTCLGGYLGSLIFVMLVTAIGNLETLMFGKTVHVKLFPEVIIALFFAVSASALIHRICATTCILFSMVQLYYINKYSQKVYSVPISVQSTQTGKKKKQ